jgi:hypothetical protein
MILQRLSEMLGAKNQEPEYDFLQSLMFNTVVSFYNRMSSGPINVSAEVADFISDCYTYITRDRELQINSMIEAELKNLNDEEMNQIQNDIQKQDEYYCNGILQYRKQIFNKTQ